MSRATRATIHLGALRHNLSVLKQRAANSRVIAVVKANAYGHGLEAVVRALHNDAEAFAVASLDEALRIRAAGVGTPVILLEGVFGPEELDRAAEENFEIVVHTTRQLEWLQDYQGDALTVWLKLDSGMNRLGFKPDEFVQAHRRLNAMECVVKPPRLMTHLAKADELDDAFTQRQLDTFIGLVATFPGERSVANSAGTLAYPSCHQDWVRPGLALYGASPLANSSGPAEGLQPVMTVSTELIAVKKMQAGETVGYGANWVAPEAMPYGIAAIGYGDGYPRHAPNGTPVLVNGQRAALIGRVSMDMIAIDLRGHEAARPGDKVILWGKGLPVEEIAAAAGTIPYELLCGVTQRVNFTLDDAD